MIICENVCKTYRGGHGGNQVLKGINLTIGRGEKIALLFQPHLYSRTRDFAPGFAEALKGADFVGILPIYAARERAMAGVDSAMLAARYADQ